MSTKTSDRETEIIKKKDNLVLLKMNVRRVAKGVELYLQSDILEDFFSALSGQAGYKDQPVTSTNAGWSEKKSYRINQGNLVPSGLRVKPTIDKWGNNNLFPDGYTNLSFLRVVGLQSGVRFTIPIVITTDALKEYINEAKYYVKQLYIQYLKPLDMTVELTTKEVNHVQVEQDS